MANLQQLIDIQILLGDYCLLPMLRSLHSLMQFAQCRDLLVCDYVAMMQSCMAEIDISEVDPSTTFAQNVL